MAELAARHRLVIISPILERDEDHGEVSQAIFLRPSYKSMRASMFCNTQCVLHILGVVIQSRNIWNFENLCGLFCVLCAVSNKFPGVVEHSSGD